ncbi:POK18 protein, partial [Atrichornis clamosus]|nr:POK18 protein [Atrichornis clamosus]
TELMAINMAFSRFVKEAINIVAESMYAAGVLQRLDYSCLKDANNPVLMVELRTLWSLINNRQHDYYVLHARSHSDLPAPIAEGNRIADLPAMTTVVPNLFEQARLSHDLSHQNTRALKRRYQLTLDQARNTVLACPDCQPLALMPTKEGVSP